MAQCLFQLQWHIVQLLMCDEGGNCFHSDMLLMCNEGAIYSHCSYVWFLIMCMIEAFVPLAVTCLVSSMLYVVYIL